jgi:hypothetical protein
MKEYILNHGTLADSANWLTACQFTKTNPFTPATDATFAKTT